MNIPSIHGGHTIFCNHGKWTGLKSENWQKKIFLRDKCQRCSVGPYCYNMRLISFSDPEEFNFVLLELVRCYIEIAEEKKIRPFSIGAHFPLPLSFQQVLVNRYKVGHYLETLYSGPLEQIKMFVHIINDCFNKIRIKGLIMLEIDMLVWENVFQESSDQLSFVAETMSDVIRIASVHWIGNPIRKVGGNEWGEQQPVQEYVEKYGLEKQWVDILEATLKVVQNPSIDLLAHLFLGQKYLPYCPRTSEIKKVIQEIAQVCAENDIVVELNSSGFLKGIHKDEPDDSKNPYFPAEWLDIFKFYGVKFTCGDDSHSQAQIGQGYNLLKKFIEKNDIEIWIPGGRKNNGKLIWHKVE